MSTILCGKKLLISTDLRRNNISCAEDLVCLELGDASGRHCLYAMTLAQEAVSSNQIYTGGAIYGITP